MFNINIDDKIKKLARRKECYDLAKKTESPEQKSSLYSEARKLDKEVYTSVFIDFLKSNPIGHVVWSDGITQAKISISSSQYTKYDRIVRFSKVTKEKSEDHIYFDNRALELLLDLDQDALKLFADLHERKMKAKLEIKRLEKALKAADSHMKLKHFNVGNFEIVLKDGRVITQDYFMGKPYIKVERIS